MKNFLKSSKILKKTRDLAMSFLCVFVFALQI
jgi:hypothetical protein